jgi:hypothetical protein
VGSSCRKSVRQPNPKKNEVWKEVPEKEGPLRSREIDRKTKCGRMTSNCSIQKSGTQKQDIGMTVGRKEWWGRGGPRTIGGRRRRKILQNVAVCVH